MAKAQPGPVRAELKLTGAGVDGMLVVDGNDISHAVRGLRVDARDDHVPKLTVDLILFDGLDVEAEADLVVPEPTRRALVALGWTSPATGE